MNPVNAVNTKSDAAHIGKLFDHYFEINEGIGVHKSPKLYGAFPIDAYSHTPFTKGAQQPGMTGQVKEDVLTRLGELGVFIEAGVLGFQPSLLRDEEFLTSKKSFTYFNVHQEQETMTLNEGSLAFTYCQVPIVYQVDKANAITILYTDGTTDSLKNLVLDSKTSNLIFKRTGIIKQLIVSLKR